MNVRDRLLNALEPLGVEVRYQGSLSDEEPLSETLITYQIIDSSDEGFYDNEATKAITQIQLMIYSTKMSIIKDLPDHLSQLIKQAGFVRESRGKDAGFFNHHYAWLMEIHHTERMPMHE
jgi:hypothetical protein